MRPSPHGFQHECLFYTGEDGFLAGTLPFLRDAQAGGEPALVVITAARMALLREALGADAARVRFADMAVLGPNPARIIPAWWQFLERSAREGPSVRGIGEPIWPGRSPAELTECQRHEALLNTAFDGGPRWRLLCPYDLHGLDDRVIEEARRSHPFVAQNGDASRLGEAYTLGQAARDPFAGVLEPPPAGANEVRFSGQSLTTVRERVGGWATGQGLDAERTAQLVLAMSEVATNSVRYGGGGGAVQMWSESETLLIDVQDRGHITDPLVGRTPPSPDQRAGRGLWLANQLCDLVQIRSTEAGTVVRLHIAAAPCERLSAENGAVASVCGR